MNKPKNHIAPPKLAQRLLKWFLKNELAEEVLGDLDEKFYKTLESKSERKAKRNYWYQVKNYIRPFALKRTKVNYSNTIGMYRHFLKISWRGMLRNKVFSTIKIGGFSIGIAACILISLFTLHELDYDKHYENSDRIFRIANEYRGENYFGRWTNMQGPFKEVLEEHLPDINQLARVVKWKWGNVGENHIRKVESKQNIYEEGFFYADPELLSILEIPMVYGNQSDALASPNSIVISEKMAKKYFPGENPMGRQLILNDNAASTYTVGGVMEDFPITSHLQGEFIMTLFERTEGPGVSDWCCSNYDFYVKLLPNTNKEQVEQKLIDIRDTYVIDLLTEAGNNEIDEIQNYQSYYLQPVSDIYLNEAEIGDHIPHGSIYAVWVFSAIAVVILVLACLNFINLSTAKSIKRAKEVGLRKVVGSFRSGLIRQFLAESIFFSMISIFIGLLLAWGALPYFNDLADKQLTIPFQSVNFILLLVLAGFVIGAVSGVYPAFYLSRFKPVEVLKGSFSRSTKASFFRSGMVVFQFATTIVLIIAALVTHQQFDHYMNKSLGYEKEQVINILGINTLPEQRRELLKEELLRLPNIQSATLGDYLPVSGSRMTNYGFSLDGSSDIDPGFEAARWIIDEDYLATMSMELSTGSNFNPDLTNENSIIINESMAEAFHLEDPIGTRLVDMFDGKYNVIGVVKDFYFESLTADIRPLTMVYGRGQSTLSIKLSSTEMENTLEAVENKWSEFQPNQPLRYTFLDQRFEEMYRSFQRARNIFLIFSLLSIIVASLGLFALSAFIIEQRNKEVSVRKVLGASTSGIFNLLAKDFVKLVLIATLLAIPLGWYLMQAFLQDLANRITLSWEVFAVATIGALLIALLTISYESIKAALANPVKTLRSE